MLAFVLAACAASDDLRRNTFFVDGGPDRMTEAAAWALADTDTVVMTPLEVDPDRVETQYFRGRVDDGPWRASAEWAVEVEIPRLGIRLDSADAEFYVVRLSSEDEPYQETGIHLAADPNTSCYVRIDPDGTRSGRVDEGTATLLEW